MSTNEGLSVEMYVAREYLSDLRKDLPLAVEMCAEQPAREHNLHVEVMQKPEAQSTMSELLTALSDPEASLVDLAGGGVHIELEQGGKYYNGTVGWGEVRVGSTIENVITYRLGEKNSKHDERYTRSAFVTCVLTPNEGFDVQTAFTARVTNLELGKTIDQDKPRTTTLVDGNLSKFDRPEHQ